MQRNASARVSSTNIYAIQCFKCEKWCKIDTQKEYESIRSTQLVDPYVCEKKKGKSCQDGADLEYDASQIWTMDTNGLPKTPEGFRRILRLRSNFHRFDTYYESPTLEMLKSRKKVADFFEANPQFEKIPLEEFNFKPPKVIRETVYGLKETISGKRMSKKNRRN